MNATPADPSAYTPCPLSASTPERVSSAQRDAYLTVQALLEIRAVLGQPIDADAEARAIWAAHNLTTDLITDESVKYARGEVLSLDRAEHLVRTRAVLYGWLDFERAQLHYVWRRCGGWAVPA